ncbi:MAG: hypothetical protein DSO07_01910 [Thermoproteota archaeon]|jgi:uncharacterized membrane protein|uniref:Uncharacterized protein n=1 Tax=Candidatus Methanodesulfokora washburnensis TaxID=2478471 RepID=A0A3R9QHK5_9CREN|nr:hypothetical protein [Candidatus Methanodesulfokores washburnensis]RSN76702.1 hypothetical protein D6D85_03585 [Candidatus Methanodesulfokores washburnensis]TDA41943.1 MAG: hypothetical protein DSO07_01910 [Candidatus Korarchaeota archaeon]
MVGSSEKSVYAFVSVVVIIVYAYLMFFTEFSVLLLKIAIFVGAICGVRIWMDMNTLEKRIAGIESILEQMDKRLNHLESEDTEKSKEWTESEINKVKAFLLELESPA